MAELTLERRLNAGLNRVFEFITQPQNLTQWWGPEGVTIPEGDLDFSRLGPWDSVMMNAEGQRYHVSGEVTEISAPNSVSFTWAWHDENGDRGHESQVRLELEPQGDATLMRIIHTGLPDEDSAQSHNGGWTSTLNKLEKLLN